MAQIKKFNYTYKYMAGIQTKEMLNGDIYIGETKMANGKGTLKTSNNRSYEGYWKDDKPHGFGRIIPQWQKFTEVFKAGINCLKAFGLTQMGVLIEGNG